MPLLAMTVGQRAAVFVLGVVTLLIGLIVLLFGGLSAYEQEWTYAGIAVLIGAFAIHSSRDMIEGKRV